ncbi:MAG: NAD-dependent malic enzyme [Alphaproteobacteria bacterium]|nr:NAD-dependent malic enzyme [Alphaproteobacteria bacterium]
MKNLFNKVAAKVRAGWDKFRGRKNEAPAPEPDLRGLLPHRVLTQEQQKELVLENLRRKTSDIEKYLYLSLLQASDERLFYYTAFRHTEEIMPLIYTPTVGQACLEFSHLPLAPKGLYITPEDKGKIRELLDNWPEDDVRVIVITDGGRILGLGDLGANGMGIPLGKLALYTICGGIDPRHGMPVMFDVGTNNAKLRSDPLYIGYPHPRLTGTEYLELMDEFVTAVKAKFPKAIIQFEDFQTANAFKLLELYRNQATCFNDDIQGTAAVALAGVYASLKSSGQDFKDQRIMFLGAGSAATGIAGLMVRALQECGLSEEEARQRLWLVDSKGLVTAGRGTLEENKQPYAHDHAAMNLLDAIRDIKPTVLIGATGTPGTFTREVIEAMAAINQRPLIFALSNPTSQAECTAQQAYEWSQGQALFASGSPFEPVEYDGKTFRPGQGNNAYIFPGLGLGVMACGATRITEEMFLAAAHALAELVTAEDLRDGTLYPPLKNIRCVSEHIAKAVIETACAQGVSSIPLPPDIIGFISRQMYDPACPPKLPPKPPGIAPK